MSNASTDIIGQSGWDLWCGLCAAAAGVLLCYATFGRARGVAIGATALVLSAIGILGTALVLAAPPLHQAGLGLAWTFAVLVLLSAVFYLNLLPQLGLRRTATLLALRTIALAALVTMLFMPGCRYVSRPKAERPLLFVFDTSGSMSFPDVQNGPTRIQSVWQTLRPLLGRVDDHFVPQYFTFATDLSDLKRPADLARLTADGKSTDLVTGVTKAVARVPRPDAEVILFSDGIDNASPNVADAIAKLGRRVHTITVGSEQAEPATLANVAVDNVEAADDFVVNHETKVKATIKSTALANRVVDVKMSQTDADGQPIGEVTSQKLVLQPVVEGQAVELTYKPRTVGVHRLAVWVDPIAGERSTADNRQEFQGLALDPRIRVLYVEGRARPEYRDLNRALARDSNIEVATLLRIQQDRFTAGGTVDGEPFRAMPQTADEWKRFDVILLGDLDVSFLTAAQQAAIEQRVGGGAGLLMIGGQNSFGPGGYQGTPIERALPVFCGDTGAGQEKSEFVPRLTPEGLTHPAMEGLADWFGGGSGEKADKVLPPLRGNVVVPKPKVGAQVLLVHPDRPGPDGQPQIVLAAQRYGQGRSMACTVDTTYLWYLPLRGLGQDSPYNRFWGQITRWLAGEDVRNRQRGAGVEGLLNKSLFQLGESVRVRAMVRDEKGDVTRYAQVGMTLTRAGAKPEAQAPLAANEQRAGMYDATIATPEKGDYTIELAASKDGKELGRQKLRFTVIPPADEMLKLASNPLLMASIANATKGYGYRLDQLPTLIDELIRSDTSAKPAEEVWVPLYDWPRAVAGLRGGPARWPGAWDLPIQGALAFVLLAAEWLLRRKWQLP